ncbi:hypothetical protein [Cellulomonas aerilata]|uniref:Uncharacterized protein n=1 Tax=Cellulomonas aerilata TaxID=515326 RepID=A0A512DDF9_9CELL|nr:hypothetical protein [Cellulomonas aerilata]GEO34250.1 hypothetical protein CAE01nite_19750 [Cellulomonas aerilata]
MTATPTTTAPRPTLDARSTAAAPPALAPGRLPTELPAEPPSRLPLEVLTGLRDELRDALEAAAEQDPDELASHTPGGARLLSLAARARRAVRALGAPAGVPLTDGPGVVVLRDAATTASLLDAAFDPRFTRRLG